MKRIALLCVYASFSWILFINATASDVSPKAYTAVNGALQAWEHSDWKTMYSFLSSRDKKDMPIADFVKKRSDISIVEKLVGYSILSSKVVGDGRLNVTVKLTMLKGPDTSLLPSRKWIPENVVTTLHLVCDPPTGWKISFKNN